MVRVVVVRREARRFGRENVTIECLDLSRCIECASHSIESFGGNRRYVSSTNGRRW